MVSQQLKFDGDTVEQAMAKARAACGASVRVVFARRLARKRGVLPFGPRQRFELVVEAPTPEDFQPERLNLFASRLREAVASAPAPTARTESRTRNAIASYRAAGGESSTEMDVQIDEPASAEAWPGPAWTGGTGARVYGPGGPKPLAIEPRRPSWGTLPPQTEVRAATWARPGQDDPVQGELLSEAIAGLMGLERPSAESTRQQASVPASVIIDLIRLCELPPLDRPVAVILTTTTPDGESEFETLVDTFNIPMDSAWDLRKERLRATMQRGFDPELLRNHLVDGVSFAAHVDAAMEEEWRALFSPTHRVLSALQVHGSWSAERLTEVSAASPAPDVLAVSGEGSSFNLEGLMALGLPFATLNGRPSTLAAWLGIAVEAAARQ
ncbi:MAG: hypothetical protein M0Z47_10035 [Actinomycetota bacterium]|nr:hypothetical protein [Actinomycetota bacterium]